MRGSPLLLLLLVGCSDGDLGDLARIPPVKGDVRGTGARLSDLNDPSKPQPTEGAEVNVTGVTVVAVDEYDETNNGSSIGNLYVQDLPIDGQVPRPQDYPSGCRFRPRCKQAFAPCENEPTLKPKAGGDLEHRVACFLHDPGASASEEAS